MIGVMGGGRRRRRFEEMTTMEGVAGTGWSPGEMMVVESDIDVVVQMAFCIFNKRAKGSLYARCARRNGWR